MQTKHWEVYYSKVGDIKVYKTNRVYKGNGTASKIAKQLASQTDTDTVQTVGYDAYAHWSGTVIYKGQDALPRNVFTITNIN